MRSTQLQFAPPITAIAPDCRHYRGDKPCEQNRLCDGCHSYEPYNARICIIKLGALGDVIRTLSILPELHRRYRNAHITWVSKPSGKRMIESHELIDRTLTFDAMTAMQLAQEKFDVAICLDKEPEPCALMNALNARMKMGIGLSDWGTPTPLASYTEPYFYLGLSDDLKFNHNRKSYPQLVHEALGWNYQPEPYTLPVDDAQRDAHIRELSAKGWRPELPTVAINVGAGKVFANKMWPTEKIVALIEQLIQQEEDLQVLLLGGPEERLISDAILKTLAGSGRVQRVFDGGTHHDEPSFVALVDCCDVLFSGDTMAMHVAIALKKHVVVLFGPTCEVEIDLFGRGEKLVANVPCAPCYKRVCDQEDICLSEVNVVTAATSIQRTLENSRRGTRSLPVLPMRVAG